MSDKIHLFYKGKSMKGTFCPGDLLEIEKIDISHLKRGDIIVFTKDKEHGNEQIVHRIERIEQDRIVTRGDNNKEPDNLMISEKNLTGVVTGFFRGKCKKRVKRGHFGLISYYLAKLSRIWRKMTYLILLFPYKLLKNIGVGRLYSPKTDNIILNSKNGFFIKIIFKRKVIANWHPEKDYFHCKKPFDIFIGKPEYEPNKYNEIIRNSLLKYEFLSQSDET